MAKQVYWSIRVAGSSSSSPPAGLSCVKTEGALVVAYVSNPDDPDGLLLDSAHADVLQQSVVRGRRVAVLVCTVEGWDFDSATGTWELALSYADAALSNSERELTNCDICQVECLTCDAQAKLAGGYTGEADPEWIANYDGYLDENPDLGDGGLPVLDPP